MWCQEDCVGFSLYTLNHSTKPSDFYLLPLHICFGDESFFWGVFFQKHHFSSPLLMQYPGWGSWKMPYQILNTPIKARFSSPAHPSAHTTRIAFHFHTHTGTHAGRESQAADWSTLWTVSSCFCRYLTFPSDDGGGKSRVTFGLALILMWWKCLDKSTIVHWVKVIFSNILLQRWICVMLSVLLVFPYNATCNIHTGLGLPHLNFLHSCLLTVSSVGPCHLIYHGEYTALPKSLWCLIGLEPQHQCSSAQYFFHSIHISPASVLLSSLSHSISLL